MSNITKSQIQRFALPSHAQSARCRRRCCKALHCFAHMQSNVMLCRPVEGRLPTNLLTWPPQISSSPRRQYDCVCLKYGSGHLHKVSHTAWYQHLASTCTEEERQHIQTARVLADRIESLPPLTRPSSTPNRDYLVPPSIWRAETCQGLAKWARENRDPNEYVGRRKCARVRIQQPIEQAGPSNSGDQVSI